MAAVTVATLRMRPGDVDDCWRLDQICFADGETYDRATFRDLIAHCDALCFKTVAAESVRVGFIIGVVEQDRTGHVVVLGVAPEWRRRGVGRDLMRQIETAFRERGVQLIHLEVRTTNAGARALYEGLGFTVAGRRLAYYTNGDDGFLMIKAL